MLKDTYFCTVQKSIAYKNIQISFSVKGKGSAVVLLHGFLENSTMWNDISDELSKKNKVICIDLLGHGNSDCLGYVHSMTDMADAVKFVLKTLRIRRTIFIGHSMGGYVALAFAEKYPKNVKGLCLMNSTAQADSEDRKKIRLRAIQMAKTSYQSLVSMSISNLFAEDTRNLFTQEIEIVKDEALKTPAQGYIANAEGMRLRPNREHILLEAEFKKLYIIGEKDPVLEYESIVNEANRTNSMYITLSSGHMSHIEDKEKLLESIGGLIKH